MIRQDDDHDAVCSSKARHLLVTAPPGTGKTFLTVRLAGELVPHLPPGSAALVLTFSNQARTQLEREAALQLSPDLRRSVEISNYHSFFWRAVNAYRRALGLPEALDIGSRRRRHEALRTAVGREILKPLETHTGLLDALSEHRYQEFQDGRTPEPDVLERLLDATRKEQRAGRLVFDDLGALFWELLVRFPAVEAAYRRRFPVVIADEHQDASALQDVVVRRLAEHRLLVFADPMQLIHGFRGASDERLEQHRKDCDEERSLGTSHRWHGCQHLAEWLLAVRKRLCGQACPCQAPAELRAVWTSRLHGLNAVKPQVKYAALKAFRMGHQSVAVLSRTNEEVGELQRYLCRQGLHPRQIGTADFEEARDDIERLLLLRTSETVAAHALQRVSTLVPALRGTAIEQARRRLGPDGVDIRRAGAHARLLLEPLKRLYEGGPRFYFEVLVGMLAAAQRAGHHIPQREALRALQRTGAELDGDSLELEEALAIYTQEVMQAAQAAPRPRRGLFVMTAHQAKGKEFDHVILADASAHFFPDNWDSRKLFYVAVTRATKGWTVIAPDDGASPLLGALFETDSAFPAPRAEADQLSGGQMCLWS